MEPLLIVLVLLLSVLLRWIFVLTAGPNFGVDQWTWKTIINRTRAERMVPDKLENFLLDEKQWYPPLFQVFMAVLPKSVFEKYGAHVAISLDLVRAGLVGWVVFSLTQSLVVASLAILAYALSPIAVIYNLQLNPRGLAAILLDLAGLCIALYFMTENFALLVVAICLGALILLCHKMTSQLMVFLALVITIKLSDFKFLALIGLMGLLAYLVSFGYYRNVLRAHLDILRFWFNNWQWAGSHPILESPIYGEDGYTSPSRVYRSGPKAFIERLSQVFAFSPWSFLIGTLCMFTFFLSPGIGIELLDIVPVIAPSISALSNETAFWIFGGWASLIFLFSILTTVVPWFRFLGRGYLYGYNGAFPAAVTTGICIAHAGFSWVSLSLLALGIAVSASMLFVFWGKLKRSRTLGIAPDLMRAIRRLAELPTGVVTCFPQHWHDAVAHIANQPVLFGGKGYGFKQLQPVFPRLLIPIDKLVQHHNVKYLLTHVGYCNEKFLADLPPANVELFGEYELYIFEGR